MGRMRFVSAGNLRAMLAAPAEGYNQDPNVYPGAYNTLNPGGDSNRMPYDTNVVWGKSAQTGITQISQVTGQAISQSGQVVNPGWVNPNVTNQLPFSALPGAQSIQILQKNLKRNMIIIQNLSSVSNLWFCFGRPAIPNLCPFLVSGQFIGLDFTCPPDALYVYFDGTATTQQPGMVTEITRMN
jgi:hypothetical protein